MNHIVIVHTGGGISYANRICKSIRWIADHRNLDIETHLVNASGNNIQALLETLPKQDTVIHPRAAHPDANFMRVLKNFWLQGWRVVNNPDVLRLTSDKAACALFFQNRAMPHPKTWVVDKAELPHDVKEEIKEDNSLLIIKPTISNGQGKYVQKVYWPSLVREEWWRVREIPGDRVVIQRYIPYTALYRVICIAGKALPYAFVDKPDFHPENWKVSVCLNKEQRFVPNPSYALLKLAERVQSVIEGNINFIDIFETEPGNFVISEVNTACSLRIHELLARNGGADLWNIHYQIARYLVNNLI